MMGRPEDPCASMPCISQDDPSSLSDGPHQQPRKREATTIYIGSGCLVSKEVIIILRLLIIAIITIPIIITIRRALGPGRVRSRISGCVGNLPFAGDKIDFSLSPL